MVPLAAAIKFILLFNGLHMQLMLILGREGGKLENPEKNPPSTGEINYDNSIHTSPKFEIQCGAVTRCSPIQLLTQCDTCAFTTVRYLYECSYH